MSLQSLPEELLVIIIRQLDVTSVNNLYETGNAHIQNVISTQGVIKKCHLSMNSMATVQTLKTDFFRSISANLQELCMRGVHDLNKTLLLPAVNKLKVLKTLDISYTNITIFDLLDIYKKCPNLKNISIDFKFSKANSKNDLTERMVNNCQDMFGNFQNVTFVGSLDNLLYSKLSQLILKKSNLDTLIFNINKSDKIITNSELRDCIPLSCNKFFVNVLNWKLKYQAEYNRIMLPTEFIVNKIDFEYEYLISDELNSFVCCTEVFTQFLDQKFNIRSDVKKIPNYFFIKNITFMFWRKETTNFDNTFFSDLYTKLKDHFPSMNSYSEDILPEKLHSDWVYLTHPAQDAVPKNLPAFKKRRLAVSYVPLKYDSYLESFDKVKLSVNFHDHIRNPVSLAPEFTFLRKLTFLSLTGAVRYAPAFFNILFHQCENLVTLCVDSPSVSPCLSPILRNIPISRTLKNLRVSDKSIDLNFLFYLLAQCKTLENIQIIDQSKVAKKVFDLFPHTLFKECRNLYYFSVQAHMSDSAKKSSLQILNKCRQDYGPNALYIEFVTFDETPRYTYDPFVEVFQLFRIKAVN